MVAGGLAIAAATLVGLAHGRNPQATTQLEPFRLTGVAKDLAATSRVVFSSTKSLRCFDVLPDGKAVRFVWQRPGEVVDVDLRTGEQTPATVVPEAIRTGCPQLSPDRRRLLYVKDDENKRSQIMLSPHSDGSEAIPITEGNSPVWMPSGEEFLYSFDNHRPAVFALPKTRLLFPDSPPVEKVLQQIVANQLGDRVAFLFMDSRRQLSVDVHAYPSMERVQHLQLLTRSVGGLQFDDVRDTLQLSMPDPRELALAELTSSNKLTRLGKIGGINVLNGFRTEEGIALLTTSFSHSVVREGPGGRSREYAFSASGTADVTPTGDVVFDRRTDDGRSVIAYQRSDDAIPRILSDGPNDLYPTFSPDGGSVAFIRVPDGTIVMCDVATKQCRQVFADTLGPKFARFSPDGRRIAYQTTHGSATRLRIVDLKSSAMRDLGLYRSSCPPTWSSASALWMYDRARAQWNETSVEDSRPTGRTAPARQDEWNWVCDAIPVRADQKFHVRRLESRNTEVRMAASY